jgi:hypothetical protein
MMELHAVLQGPEREGYPTEYLVARLRGRREHFIRDWKAFLAPGTTPPLPGRYGRVLFVGDRAVRPDEAVRQGFHGELLWVWREMNVRLRKVFEPLFIWLELSTLFACVRLKMRKGAEESLARLFASSLLSEELKSALRAADSPSEALLVVEDAFASIPLDVRGLKERFMQTGRLREAEERLTDEYLKWASGPGLHPVLKEFFGKVIDMRNMVSAYKHLRWGVGTGPPFLRGGRLRGMEAVDREALEEAALKLTGSRASRPSDIEGLLLRNLLRYSERAARTSAEGLVLDYLLKCFQEARNLGIVLSSAPLYRGRLMEELVV